MTHPRGELVIQRRRAGARVDTLIHCVRVAHGSVHVPVRSEHATCRREEADYVEHERPDKFLLLLIAVCPAGARQGGLESANQESCNQESTNQ